MKKQTSRTPVRKNRKAQLGLEPLEPRCLLAGLQGISVDDGSLLQSIETTAPREMTLKFDADEIISDSVSSLAGITLVHGGADRQLDTADDVTVQPGFLGIGDRPNEVVIRFAENLPDNIYRLEISGNGSNAVRNVFGEAFDQDATQPGIQDFQRVFRLDLGAQVVSVVPQPIERNADGSLTQRLNQIEVYFNNDPLNQASAERVEFYQLRYSGHTNEYNANFDTVHDMDDVVHLPQSVSYDVTTNRATLTFASDLHLLDNDLPGQDRDDGTGTYRLQVGLNSNTPINNSPDHVDGSADPGDEFSTALDLGEVFARGVIVDAAIDPRVDPLEYPGATDEPGHRLIAQQDHFINGAFASDLSPGATTILYNFQDVYGQDPDGVDLQNLITENQKTLSRQILDIYSYHAGLQFIETADLGFTIATGDLRALAPNIDTGEFGVIGIATGGNFIDGVAIMDATEVWTDEYSAERIDFDRGTLSWFSTAMHEIGHVLGLGHTHELPANTNMGQDEFGGDLGFGTQNAGDPESVFPGDHDIAHLQHIHRPESNDVDLYQFEVGMPGIVSIETFAERFDNASLADTSITVWKEVNGTRTRVASNDDYFSEDSFLELSLDVGSYYVGVSSSGNNQYNPNFPNSGAGGTSEGDYQLRIHHRAELARTQQIQDKIEALNSDPIFTPSSSQPLDGDYDGVAGGAFNFWFRATTPENTLIVDKSGNGEFTEIDQALSAAQAGDIVRVVGNGGADGDLGTIGDNSPYLIGRSILGTTLEDGARISLKRGVTLMVDEGAILKFRGASILSGSTAPALNQSGSAVQILGTPDNQVILGSYRDDSLGGDSDGFPETPSPGDWGGILFVGDVDQQNGRFNYEDQGIFLNHINNANISNAGGQISVDSITQTAAPIEMRDIRVTATFNTISNSAESAIAASPDSFEETNFHSPEFQTVEFSADYSRVGPVIHGNTLVDNTFNALFVRTETVAGEELRPMTVTGRWDDTDIPHVVAENLVIRGQASFLLDEDNILPSPQEGVLIAKLDAQLRIDPGTVVKLDGSLIEVGFSAQLIAEGLDGKEVIFTSLFDDTYGGSGTFDTNSDGPLGSTPTPGDWGGIYLSFTSNASIDHARIAYGGGTVPVEGSFAGFNAIEVHAGDLRLTNSVLDNNAGGTGGQAPATRFGRTTNGPGAIFLRDTQPILVNNVIQNTRALAGQPSAGAISIDVNSLNRDRVIDVGRQTGNAVAFRNHVDNQGPLINRNRLGGNDLNGMEVRGGTLTTEGVWDDTDIVHMVFSEIAVPNFHTFGGLRLESSPLQSLVVKLSSSVRGNFSAPFFTIDPITLEFIATCDAASELRDTDGDGLGDTCVAGTPAGFTAAGRTLDIDDRIGGSLHIVGHPNFPVVLTSISDDTVGAGQTPQGDPQLTAFRLPGQAAAAGDWRGVRLEEFSNDRNVDTVTEFEPSDINFADTSIGRNNATTTNAQFIGQLAGNLKSGDDNLRLGFDIHGTLARRNDVDTYSFDGVGGTEVWFDIDHTTNSLNAIIEFVNADGEIIASSESSHLQMRPDNNTDPELPDVNARNLSKTGYYTTDHYSINRRDPGMRLELPGSGTNTFHVRVRSNGLSAGAYEMQIRLTEVDEIAGSTVKFADIRYATNGIELIGVPGHSPLLGEIAEVRETFEEVTIAGERVFDYNFTMDVAQPIGNVLDSDRAAVSVAGTLSDLEDVDWYEFQVVTPLAQSAGAFSSITIDLDYSDGTSRANASFALYTEDPLNPDQGVLVAFSDDSNIADDLNAPGQGADVDDQTRGSFGVGDGFLGPISLAEGTYHLAVFPDSNVPRELAATFDRNLLEEFPDEVHRFIPVDSVNRLAIDHADGIAVADTPLLDFAPVPLSLHDLKLFVTTDGRTAFSTELNTVNAFTGAAEYIIGEFGSVIGDFAVRPQDGALITLSQQDSQVINDASTGISLEIDPHDGSATVINDDDGILTFQADADGMPEEADVGVLFEALTFGDGNFYGAGNLGDPALIGPDFTENILYLFDYFDYTAQPDEDDAKRMPEEDAAIPFEGAWTDIVELGEIDTVGSAPGDERLTVEFDATGAGPEFNVDDGDSFDADGVTYEINTGAQIVVTSEEVRDGDLLRLDIGGADYDFQFDTGPALELRTVTGVGAGGTFTLGAATFEYVMGGLPSPGNVPIDISGVATIDQLSGRIEATVEANTGGAILVDFVNVTVGGQPTVRVSFQGDSGLPGTTVVTTGNLGGLFVGEYGHLDSAGIPICSPASTCVVVGVEETDTLAELSDKIIDAYRIELGTTNRVGADLGRMNFLDADSGRFIPRSLIGGLEFIDVRPGDTQLVTAGAVAIELLADESAEEIAFNISRLVPNSSIDPNAADTLLLNTGWSNATDPPFHISGSAAMGGLVTGIAFNEGSLYAVTDTGGLFKVDDLGGPISTTFVANIGPAFVGLTAGPQEYYGDSPREDEDGNPLPPPLANMFIGIDDAGDLHAFDTNGIAFDIFDSGVPGEFTNTASSGIIGANGIGFSNYQVNAWHNVTGRDDIDGVDMARFDDPGHGVVTPVTEIPECPEAFGNPCGTQGLDPLALDYDEADGDASYYFGRERRTELNGRGFDSVTAYEYDWTAGARGGIQSAPISLVNYDAADRPFLYFNYVVDTEDTNGTADNMADSFRVYAIDDFGAYHLLGTNNSLRALGQGDEFDEDPNVNLQNYGHTQELFDNQLDRAVNWRQARIPLSPFAGQENLQIRFDFSTEGGRNNPALPGDSFGRYSADYRGNRTTGVTDNIHEGVWIDDIIIGLAERGELIASTTRVSTEGRIVNNPAVPEFQINSGAYQLEIRRGMDYFWQSVIDSNDRLTKAVLILPAEADVLAPAGQSFEISNGLEEFVFEFVEAGQNPTIADSITVGFQPGATRLQIATALVNRINTIGPTVGLNITAELTRGTSGFVNLHGDTVIMIDDSGLDSSTRYDEIGDGNRLRDQGQVVISSNFIRDSAEYGIRVESSQRELVDGFAAHPGAPINYVETNISELAPGATLVNNVIVRGGTGGILINGDPVADSSIVPQAATPVARVLNNTVVGAISGTFGNGITVTNNASPTLLNNILDSLFVGILVDFSSRSTVVGGNLFRNVDAVGTLGDFGLQLAAFQTLFVDPLTDNFFPADGSQAIDSSIDSLNDRDELVSVREPLGISRSPILAPLRDASGQLRVDDPNVDNSSGQGSGVFIDRGALDRSDFTGPNAAMIGPRDNDPDGIDLNSDDHDLSLLEDVDSPLTEFLIQLVDGGGTDTSLGGFGVDDTSVISDAVMLFRDDELLVEGAQYSFEYDSTNNQIHLVPATGVWPVGIYRIELANTVQDLFGNPLLANRADGDTLFNINVGGGEFDFGDAPTPYPTTLDADGARHSLADGSNLFLGSAPTTESNSRPTDTDDGVIFTTDIVQGSDVTVELTASRAGFLDAWFDFNGDGDWNDAGEQVATSLPLVAGINTLTTRVPDDATVTTTFIPYARFRLSDTGGLLPTGEVDGGEVEDYAIDIDNPGNDFGDAPSIYPTLSSVNGAVHAIVPGFYLGTTATGEDDAHVSADASGDDGDDGVVFNDPFVVGQSTSLTISATRPGVLSAWIDWNGDRTWSASEQILTNQSLVAGANELTIDTPADAVVGDTISRFRFATSGGLQVTGAAADGEVEDYLVSVVKLAWHNASSPLDVDNSGSVAPLDANIVITELNNRNVTDDVGRLPDIATPPPFFDVNNDGFVAPIDALLIINELNRRSGSSNAALSSTVTASEESPASVTRDLAFENLDNGHEEEEDEKTNNDPWWLT